MCVSAGRYLGDEKVVLRAIVVHYRDLPEVDAQWWSHHGHRYLAKPVGLRGGGVSPFDSLLAQADDDGSSFRVRHSDDGLGEALLVNTDGFAFEPLVLLRLSQSLTAFVDGEAE